MWKEEVAMIERDIPMAFRMKLMGAGRLYRSTCFFAYIENEGNESCRAMLDLERKP